MKQRENRQRAFIDLVHGHQGILHRICSVYAEMPEDRDDLRQEILMQSWRSYPSFKGDAAFSSWFYRVALNTAMLRRRRLGSRREPTTDADLEVPAPEPREASADVERLYACIRELPPVNRAIILLHLEQHDYEEIARITGLSRGAVSVRLVRIKDRLRRRLVACGSGEERGA